MRPWIAMGALTAGAVTAFTAPSAAQDDRRFTLTPYLWLPSVDGDLRFEVLPSAEDRTEISVDPDDYFDDLELGLTLAGEARFGRFSALADIIYLDLGDGRSAVRSVSGPGAVEIPVTATAELDLESWLVSLAGGVDLVDGEQFRLQALAGVRYFDVSTSLDWRLDAPLDVLPGSGSAGRDVDAWDGIVGLRGEGRAGDWIFPYHVDVGAGDSDLTWQAIVGAAYLWDWGDIGLHYRHLAYELDDSAVENISFSGPALSASFRF